MSQAVAKLNEIPLEYGLRVEVAGRRIALFRQDDEVFAVDAVCPHRGGPLEEGDFAGHVVVCPWHGWDFDVRTGKSPSRPGAVRTYLVRIEGDDVFVVIE